MAKFRLHSIAELARQMTFAPREIRCAQVAAAEGLLHDIDPAKAYPLDFVVYRITGYRPRSGGEGLLTGLALQHDLGLLVETVSETLDERAAEQSQPVLSIEDVCARFDVTSKTIQRWRRRGLPARRFIFADGKRRVGFLLGSVERFFSARRGIAASSAQVSDAEAARMVRHARRLIAAGGCTQRLLTRRVARAVGRSPLTVLHILKRHDQAHAEDALLCRVAPPIASEDRQAILRAVEGGRPLREVARDSGLPRSAIWEVLLEARVKRLSRMKVRFIDDPLYHQPDAADVVGAMAAMQGLGEAEATEPSAIPRGLPRELEHLWRTPLLTAARERALFLKFNFHKYQFVMLRRRLDPELAGRRDLERLERQLALAAAAKNAIVQANLRLVVSVARRHLRGGVSLMELVSEGNLALMRAVESFDAHKGNRFSTYATFALMKCFAREAPRLASEAKWAVEEQVLEQVADRRAAMTSVQMEARDQVGQLLSQLSDRERQVLSEHFGLERSAAPATYDQVGRRMGITKQRVRQIEQSALAKLRVAVGLSS